MGDSKHPAFPEGNARTSRMRLPSTSAPEDLKILPGSSGSSILQIDGKNDRLDPNKPDDKGFARTTRSRHLERMSSKMHNGSPVDESKVQNSGSPIAPTAYLSRIMNNLANESVSSPAADRSLTTVNQSHKKKNRNNDSSNHHKPAEVFRKDLISAMKVPDNRQFLPEEYWVMRDTWKMEWEKGVQVPVNASAINEVKVSIVPKDARGDFRMPRKFIKATPEIGDRETVDLNVLADQTCRYDLDEVDVSWLQVINEEREWMGYPQLDEFTMEIIMEELETQCHENLQLAIKTKKGLGIEYDENIVCDVCRSPECEEGNEMVFCDGCNLCVHQACYGILKVPEGSWLCKPCALGIRGSAICILCGQKGGAMKSTRSGNKWSHVSCALWIPEITIADPDRMEPITKVSHIPASRWSLICNVCKDRVGACIQCSVRHCVTAYHVTCAIESRFDMLTDCSSPSSNHSGGDGAIIFRSYCQKHSKNCKKKTEHEEKTEEEKRSDRQKRIAELEEEFDTLVKTEGVVNTLNIPRETAVQVIEFWKLKRKANFNRHLITPKQEEAEALAEAAETGLQRRLRMFTHLRQDLERVRNLCYMIGKREKIKRSRIKNMENVFLAQINYVENRMSRNSNFDPKTLASSIPRFGLPDILALAKEESVALSRTKEWSQGANSPVNSPSPASSDVPETKNERDVLDKRKKDDNLSVKRPRPKLSATLLASSNLEISSENDAPSPGTPVTLSELSKLPEKHDFTKRNGLITAARRPQKTSRLKSAEKWPTEAQTGEKKVESSQRSESRKERIKSRLEKMRGRQSFRDPVRKSAESPPFSSADETTVTLPREKHDDKVKKLSRHNRTPSGGHGGKAEDRRSPLLSPTRKDNTVKTKDSKKYVKLPETVLLPKSKRNRHRNSSRSDPHPPPSPETEPFVKLKSNDRFENGKKGMGSQEKHRLNHRINQLRSFPVRRSSRLSPRHLDSNSDVSAQDSPCEVGEARMTIMTETISETKRFDEDRPPRKRFFSETTPKHGSHKRVRRERSLHEDKLEVFPSQDSSTEEKMSLARNRSILQTASNVDSTESSSEEFERASLSGRKLRQRAKVDKRVNEVTSRQQVAKNGKRALASPCDRDGTLVGLEMDNTDASTPASQMPKQELELESRKSLPAGEKAPRGSSSPTHRKVSKTKTEAHSPPDPPSKSPSLWDVEPDPAWKAIGLDISYGSNCPAKLRRKTSSPVKNIGGKKSTSGLKWVPLGGDSDGEELPVHPKRLGTPKDQEGYRGDMDESDTDTRVGSSRHLKHYHHKSSAKRRCSSGSGKTKQKIGSFDLHHSDSSDDFDLSMTALRSDTDKTLRQRLRAINNTPPSLPQPTPGRSHLHTLDTGAVTQKKQPSNVVSPLNNDKKVSKNVKAVGGTQGAPKFEREFEPTPFYSPTTDGKNTPNTFTGQFSPIPERSLPKDCTSRPDSNKFLQQDILGYSSESIPFANPVFAYPAQAPWQVAPSHSAIPSIVPGQYPLPVFYQYPPLPPSYHKSMHRASSTSEQEVRPSPPPMPDSTLSPESFVPTSASVAVQASVPDLSKTPVPVSDYSSVLESRTKISLKSTTLDAEEEADGNEWEIVNNNLDNIQQEKRRRKHKKKKKKKKKRRRLRFPEGVESARSEDGTSPFVSFPDPIHGAIVPKGQSQQYNALSTPESAREILPRDSGVNPYLPHGNVRTSIDNITPILSKFPSNLDERGALEEEIPKKLVLKIDKRKVTMPPLPTEEHHSSSHDSPASSSGEEESDHAPGPEQPRAHYGTVGSAGGSSLRMKFKITKPLHDSSENSGNLEDDVYSSYTVSSVSNYPQSWNDVEKKSASRISTPAALRRLGVDVNSMEQVDREEEGIGRRALRERKPAAKQGNDSKNQATETCSTGGREKKLQEKSTAPDLDKDSTTVSTPREADGTEAKKKRGRPKKTEVKVETAPLDKISSPKEREKSQYKPKDQARFAGWSTKTSKTPKLLQPSRSNPSRILTQPSMCTSYSEEFERGGAETTQQTPRSMSIDSDNPHGVNLLSSPGHPPARHWKKRKVHEHEHEKQLFEHNIHETSGAVPNKQIDRTDLSKSAGLIGDQTVSVGSRLDHNLLLDSQRETVPTKIRTSDPRDVQSTTPREPGEKTEQSLFNEDRKTMKEEQLSNLGKTEKLNDPNQTPGTLTVRHRKSIDTKLSPSSNFDSMDNILSSPSRAEKETTRPSSSILEKTAASSNPVKSSSSACQQQELVHRRIFQSPRSAVSCGSTHPPNRAPTTKQKTDVMAEWFTAPVTNFKIPKKVKTPTSPESGTKGERPCEVANF